MDCPDSGQVCIDHHCVTPGCKPTDCDPGQWCDPVAGACKPGCDSNDDCSPPATCDLASHACGQTDCCGGTCEPTGYCDSLVCECVVLCGSDEQCPTGFTCDTDSGKCQCTAGACPPGSQCDVASGECLPSGTECQTQEDCEADQECDLEHGVCIPGAGQAEGEFCLTDSNCDEESGLLCDSSIHCTGCSSLDPNFMPTFTCRYECGLLTKECPIEDRECLYRHVGLKGLCMPPE
jgi:hypothetical protein